MTALLLAMLLPLSQGNVNAGAAVVSDFERRVAEYMTLNSKVQSSLPLKPTTSSDTIQNRSKEFAEQVQAARPGAAQGDLFTPEITAEFRRLIGLAMSGHRGGRVRKSLEHAEPRTAKLTVNSTWPTGIPLQSTPPTLIRNLPVLPPELDYRILGSALVLRDVQANVILDFIPKAIP